ncbi:MAG: TolB family protein [Gemmatimonadales bacterium]
MWVRDGLRSNDLPSVSDLDNPYKYFPYRWGHALWAFIGGRWGDEAVWTVFRTAARRRDLSSALDSVLRVSKDTLTAMWHRAIEAQYRPLLERTTAASAAGSLLTEDQRGTYDIAPALSPDGRRLLYLSSRDPFAIDLYLADATTGEVLRRLTSSALDPHYESLEFVNSSGSWAPDNERIAFVAVAKGHPSLVIMRAATGDRLATYELPQFGAIYNPTWSPSGDRIAFVANQGGFLDLWTITLANGGLRRLTNDQAAELHPSWSPDGRRIAITTDRYGPGYHLALVNPETGAVTQVTTFEGATSINPRWGPGGNSLYFVANPDGIPNLYRVPISGGTPVALTRLFTGVSGISELSPAFDVAAESGTIVFTAYQKGGHHLYRLNAPETVAGGPAGTAREAAMLPPPDRRDTELVAMLTQPGPLPDLDRSQVGAYAPKFARLRLAAQLRLFGGRIRYHGRRRHRARLQRHARLSRAQHPAPGPGGGR